MTSITQNKPSVTPAALLRSSVAEKKPATPATAARTAATAPKDSFEQRAGAKASTRLGDLPAAPVLNTSLKAFKFNPSTVGPSTLSRGESVNITRPHDTKADEADRLKTAHVEELIIAPRKDFEDASAAAEKADKQLARLIAGFGPALSKEEQERAIKAFKESPTNAPIYQRVEETADKLLTAIHDAPKNRDQVFKGFEEDFDREVTAAKDLLPKLANTEHGRDAIADAVEALGTGEQGEKSSVFLSSLGDVRQAVQGADTAIVKSVAQRLLSLSKDNAGEAQKLFDGLKKAGPLLGVSNEDITKLSDSLNDIVQAKPGAVEAFKQTLTQAKIDVPGGNTDARRELFKGLGIAATAASLSAGINNAEPEGVLKSASEILQITADSGSVVTGVLSSAKDPAKFAGLAKAFDKLGGVAGVVGGLADFITSGKSFSEGDYAKGITSLLSATGGVLTGAASLVAIPVVGQIAAGLLAVGGFLGGLIIDAIRQAKEEKTAEGNAKAYLEGGGVPHDAALELSNLSGPEHKNVGPAIVQLAEHLHLEPREFLRFLSSQPREKIAFFVTQASYIPQDPKDPDRLRETGVNDNYYVDPQGNPISQEWRNTHDRYTQRARPGSITALEAYLKSENLLPPPPPPPPAPLPKASEVIRVITEALKGKEQVQGA